MAEDRSSGRFHCSSIRRNRRAAALAALVCALVPAACTTTSSSRSSTETFGLGAVLMTNTMVAGQSVRGRPIEVRVLGAGAGEAASVMIIAGIHGDETAGVPLVEMLESHLERDPSIIGGRQVVIIPRANPDGLAAHTRGNSRGVDLNRNFPAENFDESTAHGPRPLSEPEARVIQHMIELYRPSLIVSIHQPIGCIDYDGPARDIAERISRACDLPVRKLGTRPGSLGAYAGETLGIPIITVELPRGAHRLEDDELWAAYGEMLLAALR